MATNTLSNALYFGALALEAYNNKKSKEISERFYNLLVMLEEAKNKDPIDDGWIYSLEKDIDFLLTAFRRQLEGEGRKVNIPNISN